MKRIFLLLLIIGFISGCSSVETKKREKPLPSMEYRIMAESCYKKYKAAMERYHEELVSDNPVPVIDNMLDAALELDACYKSISYKIINKHYSKYAKTMKKHLEEYTKKSSIINWDITQSYDNCVVPEYNFPRCGTLYSFKAAQHSAKDTEAILEKLIFRIDDE